MNNKSRRWVLQTMAGSCFAYPALPAWSDAEAPSTQHPIEAFARRPLMQRMALSPNGESLAAIINNGNTSTLITRKVSGGAVQAVLSTDNLEFIFNWLHWINDGRLALSLRFPSFRSAPGMNPMPTLETRLVAVNADGSNLVNLVKERAGSNELRWAVNQDRVVDWLPGDGKHILLRLPNSNRSYTRVIYKVNVDTGSREFYAGDRPQAIEWITDSKHQARVSYCRDEQGQWTLWVCDPDGSNWRILRSFGPHSPDNLDVLGFGLDPQILYVAAPHQGLIAIHTIDLRDPKYTLQLKLANDRFDLSGSLIKDARGEAVGITVSRLGDSSIFFWDHRYKEWHQAVDQAMPGRYNHIASTSSDEQRYLLVSHGVGQPETWYLGEEGDHPSIKRLAAQYPELDLNRLPEKKPIAFKARDGLEVRGFLTLPKGLKKPKNLPLVLLPHGGPQSSDGPEFHDWAAFMADRGYAVLQVNFRGSTGRGLEFINAGLRRWGLEMQDDLTDAVAEFVKRGLADPARVAIVGGSYGGYAALMGVIKTPKLYQGAFAFAPVTDLLDLTEDNGQGSSREAIRRQIGDSRDDAERLKATSPRFHAEKIEKPVVLIHGTHDRQVEHRQSVWMAEALKAAGKPHEFVSLDKGDHQLSHYPYRLQTLTMLEKFLRQTLGQPQASS